MAYQNLDYKASASALGSIDEAEGIVECIVAVIGNRDSVKDIILPGAFDASLRRRKPRVVWGHDWNQPVGKVLAIEEIKPTDPRTPAQLRDKGYGALWARVQFNLGSERGREAFAMVRFFGEEQEWSIGYKTLDSVFDPRRDANLLKELELFECSPVLHGANQLTMTLSIKDGIANPASGQAAMVASALAEHWGHLVRIRELKPNHVTFDVMDDEAQVIGTFGAPMGFIDGNILFGQPTALEVKDDDEDDDRDDDHDDEDDDDANAPSPGVEAQRRFIRERMLAQGAPRGIDAKEPEDDDGRSHGGCSCGCGGTCGAGKSVETLVEAVGQIDVEEKVGRVLSARNVAKLSQAAQLIQEVLTASGHEAPAVKAKTLFEEFSQVKGLEDGAVALLREPASWSGVQVKVTLDPAVGSADIFIAVEDVVTEFDVGVAASNEAIHLFIPYSDQAEALVEAVTEPLIGLQLGSTYAEVSDDGLGDRPGSDLVPA